MPHLRRRPSAFLVATFAAGTLVVTLAPAHTPAPPDNPAPAADRVRGQRNLKVLGLAMHNHLSGHAAFPADTAAKDGTPLLSWRVALLPYLEEDALYKQFKLDEPWDGEHNKKLLAKI